MNPIPQHRQVQSIAKAVHSEILTLVRPDHSERDLAELATALMEQQGIKETWYHSCPALVLLGSRSCDSLSGRDYHPSDELVGEHNLITIDLSPTLNDHWGDCARSIYVEEGTARADPLGEEFRSGHRLLAQLHKEVAPLLLPSSTFGQLHELSNKLITASNFENLDFLGNVGHSIASSLDKRVFAEATSDVKLGSVAAFTFEPHIRELGGRWGYKHEEIYFFDDAGRAIAL